jgi:hypothetical protein
VKQDRRFNPGTVAASKWRDNEGDALWTVGKIDRKSDCSCDIEHIDNDDQTAGAIYAKASGNAGIRSFGNPFHGLSEHDVDGKLGRVHPNETVEDGRQQFRDCEEDCYCSKMKNEPVGIPNRLIMMLPASDNNCSSDCDSDSDDSDKTEPMSPLLCEGDCTEDVKVKEDDSVKSMEW